MEISPKRSDSSTSSRPSTLGASLREVVDKIVEATHRFVVYDPGRVNGEIEVACAGGSTEQDAWNLLKSVAVLKDLCLIEIETTIQLVPRADRRCVNAAFNPAAPSAE